VNVNVDEDDEEIEDCMMGLWKTGNRKWAQPFWMGSLARNSWIPNNTATTATPYFANAFCYP